MKPARSPHPGRSLAAAVLSGLLLTSCYSLLPSNGGGQTTPRALRLIRPADVAVPAGYRVEAVATGLNFPTAVAFDDAGRPHVLEAGYSYGEVFTVPRLLRVEQGGTRTEIARGERPPWNGLDYANGTFYVGEGGEVGGGRIVKISPDGKVTPLVENLPSLGDHHTNRPVVRNGYVYFGQGTATNSAVVGPDNADYGWLKRHPTFHDTPCADVTLAGRNFESDNPLTPAGDRVTTGAFLPFGTPSRAGQVVRGALPCGGSVMRVPEGGGRLELVAWGFRNPFGLAFAPDGTLYVADNSYDERGSRPVYGAGDPLWKVTPGTWYGWPDFHAGRLLSDADHFRAPGKPAPGQVLARAPGTPPKPAALLGVHSSSNGIDFGRAAFGHAGEAFVAQFGDLAPGVGKILGPVGYKVVRVNVSDGRIEDFAVNRGPENGPASKIGGGGFERPVDVRFTPAGDALYVVDFGVMTTTEKGQIPQPNTGVLWRISREGTR
ncbi:PQQ-dependent sugar dehydrogenase [Deinococcus aestuarii]|uniref:PQQ-dependent sugar dehydrogenase n=1 Tax=Deinococcus aestuarii TaxID=2774531 RepID=UPI001C0E20E3|nr:PQQ-dependent sugar dehydrogenase [Deinococcus aestuarii]